MFAVMMVMMIMVMMMVMMMMVIMMIIMMMIVIPGDMVGEVGSVNRSEGFCVKQKQVALCHHKRLQLLSGSS